MCLQAQEELYVVVKERQAGRHRRKIDRFSLALVCLRMGLRVALTSAPARSAKMRRHQVGCHKIWCKPQRERRLSRAFFFILWRVFYPYSIKSLHTSLFISRSFPHPPYPTSRVSPDMSRQSLIMQEQGPRKAAVRHARNMNEHRPMGISVATGLLESTDKRRAGLFIRQQSVRGCKQRAGREKHSHL